MNDIFISYARPDREKAKALAEALERQGYGVWWDPKIPPGKKFHQVIESVLDEVRCVVVLWSEKSIASDWVWEEANKGKQRGILLPVKIEPVNPPLGFGLIQAADLTDWTPNEPHQGFSFLLEAIAQVAGPPSAGKPGEASNTGPEAGPRLRKKKQELERLFKNSIGMEFVLIPPGSFTMGSRLTEKELARRYGISAHHFMCEKPAHAVVIKQPFYLETTPVTQGQWRRLMEDSPSHFRDCVEDCPVESISWEIDVQQFVYKLNKREKTKDYRLPSEAEWEYACRAGSNAEFFFGDDIGRLGKFAWHYENSNDRTHPVGDKEPNAFGLYDMQGNVWEWVEDDWHAKYQDAPDDARPWVDNPRGSNRVIRGGSWRDLTAFCRSAARDACRPDFCSLNLGFRLAKSIALSP